MEQTVQEIRIVGMDDDLALIAPTFSLSGDSETRIW